MKKLLLAVLAVTLLNGCAQQTFVMSNDSNEITQEQPTHFFINGLAQEKEIDAVSVCGSLDKVAKVEVQETFFNGFLRTVTFGIYTPREARVYCKV